ncbi:ABC transporter permease [Rhodobacteraceae bacterium WD3A24]|nr:ABC transporter permease [Rhodobacteraceae bacterium WD3A24]
MERHIPLPMLILAVLGFAFMLMPILVVVMAGLTAGEFLTFPPQGLSLRWVAAFLQSDKYLSSFFFSFRLAVMTMIVATILGTAAALFLSRTGMIGRGAMRAFFLSPVVLPGVVIGFALFAFFIATDMGISRTIWGLWIGHILYSTPYVIGTVGAALASYDTSLEEAARSLGASPWRAFRKVTLPNISQGIQAGSIFAFIVSFGQFEVSLFLSSPNSEPLPIAMYNSLRYQFEPSAAAAGIFAITLVTASVLLTNRLVNIRRLLERQQAGG